LSDLDKERINLEREQVIEKIAKWLVEEGYQIEPISGSEAYYLGAVKIYGNFENDESDLDVIYINIPGNSHDKVLIENVVSFSTVDKNAFNRLPLTTQDDFIFQLKQALYQLNVAFNFMDDITTIKIWKVIFFDGLSKHVLFDTISAILSANRTAEIKLGQLSDIIISRRKDTMGNT
jgi:hypothetical protein